MIEAKAEFVKEIAVLIIIWERVTFCNQWLGKCLVLSVFRHNYGVVSLFFVLRVEWP